LAAVVLDDVVVAGDTIEFEILPKFTVKQSISIVP